MAGVTGMGRSEGACDGPVELANPRIKSGLFIMRDRIEKGLVEKGCIVKGRIENDCIVNVPLTMDGLSRPGHRSSQHPIMSSVAKKAQRLSIEDKRTRMREYFLEKRDFFQLKDLENSLPKAKGIVMQSVKEILKSLVDDHLVNSEKIGTSIYYWSFPSTTLQTRKTQLENFQNELARLQQQETELKKQFAMASMGRQESTQRQEMTIRMTELEATERTLSAELEQFKEMDPDLFEQKKKQTIQAKEACDRWTDNIFAIQSYCVNKFSLERADFAKQFNIPEDFDYVE